MSNVVERAWLAAAAGVIAVALLLSGCAGDAVDMASPATTTKPAATLVDIGNGLQGPAGLVATLVSVGAPNVSAMAEDAEGRLWFGTADYTDSGSDGVYEVADASAAPTRVIAAQHTVLGLLWQDGELFVASKERIDAYGGFDGTTFATSRNVVTFQAGVGEVNGIVIGPDGRLRVGISAPCDSCTPTVANGGTVVSFSPDGSDLRVDATGIRAPIGLAYVPGTTTLLVTMNQRDDLNTATPGDWLSSVATGQDWKQPACYGQGGADCEEVPTPVATLDQHGGQRRRSRDRLARTVDRHIGIRRRVDEGRSPAHRIDRERRNVLRCRRAVHHGDGQADARARLLIRLTTRRRLGLRHDLPDRRRHRLSRLTSDRPGHPAAVVLSPGARPRGLPATGR